MSNDCVFREMLTNTSTLKLSTQNRLFTAMTPSFCSLTDTKQSLQYTIKTHQSGLPMPKFEASMNYIPPSPPSSMKQCNKSATVKFHMELLLTTTTRKQSLSGATPIYEKFCFRTQIVLSARLDQVNQLGKMSLRQIRAFSEEKIHF